MGIVIKKTRVKKKILRFNVYAFLLLLSLIAAGLTYIIPAGEFLRVNENGILHVVSGTFSFVERNPQNPFTVFFAIIQGFKKQISYILLIFFAGSSIFMLDATGAVQYYFPKLSGKLFNKEPILIFIIMAFMSFSGATGVFGNIIVVIIPFGIFISQAMGFDKTLGFFIIFFGGFSGFNVSWATPGVLGAAQKYAGLDLYSGNNIRIMLQIGNFLISYLFVLRYYFLIKKNPENSLNYRGSSDQTSYMGPSEKTCAISEDKNTRAGFVLLCMGLGVSLIFILSLTKDWNIDTLSAAFLILTCVIGLIYFKNLNLVMEHFIICISKLVTPAFIVGFGAAISIILAQGKISDTIIYFLCRPIEYVSPAIGASLMVVINGIINFFINSGSGQANTVMPLMVAFGEIKGITPQVIVQAFQFGDGLTNSLYPTVPALMAGLRFADIYYRDYLKHVWVFVCLQLVLAMFAVTILQIKGW